MTGPQIVPLPPRIAISTIQTPKEAPAKATSRGSMKPMIWPISPPARPRMDAAMHQQGCGEQPGEKADVILQRREAEGLGSPACGVCGDIVEEADLHDGCGIDAHAEEGDVAEGIVAGLAAHDVPAEGEDDHDPEEGELDLKSRHEERSQDRQRDYAKPAR